MDVHKQGPVSLEETDADRLRGIIAQDALSVGLVSAFAGDRPLTQTEEEFLARLKIARGDEFHPDLLYAITHRYFPPAEAGKLWEEILRHKYHMSEAMGRNVQITVAALDYLANLTHDVEYPTVFDEAHVAEIVGQSMRDGLTGLFNHTRFYDILAFELRRYARYGAPLSLLFIDIDDFKQVNDQYGHQEGDRVLAELAAMLMQETRESDSPCRYGGEEFGVILPFTGAVEAQEIAERIRAGAMRIRLADRVVTVSVGVASCGEGLVSARALVRAADNALYRAKREGKNRVVWGCHGGEGQGGGI